ncbi:aldo-keto reductase [Pleomassaria siparia CBS 279.74]|uniref:Aldo-keto reductase n=1 Tax=Pleomassaria siparia CBS 279.74 TaxID=1314801 RepID=A0A6G1KEJ4_9PLEO|nr:aldo-keto reductase [Pleomassaria siparia CBS 279.74]
MSLPIIPKRLIGSTPVSAIGFGAMRLAVGVTPGEASDLHSLSILTRAADMGMTFWDTSDSYGSNEALIGRWFRETGRRKEIFLATKFGLKVVDGKPEIDGSPEYVAQAIEHSLETLGTSWVDLWYVQRNDTSVPIEKTIGAMKKTVEQGKVKYLGLSECSASTLRRACAVHPIAAAEMEYSPFALEIESPQTKFLATARELGVKIVAYSPLGRGALTGTIKSLDDLDEHDVRRRFPQFSQENMADNVRFGDALAELAKEKGCTPGQFSLAWVLAQGEDIIPIPGTKHVQWLEENAKAINVEFGADDDDRVRAMVDKFGGVKGERYPEAFMKWSFVDTPELQKD